MTDERGAPAEGIKIYICYLIVFSVLYLTKKYIINKNENNVNLSELLLIFF